MTTRLFVISLTLLLISAQKNIAQKPKMVNENFIYVNSAGTQSFPGTFYIAENFSGDYAAVANKIDGVVKWAYINKSGQFITDYLFDDAKPFKKNLAKVEKKDLESNNVKVAFIDTSGQIIDNRWFISAGEFNNDSCLVSTEDGSYWFHLDGRMIKISDEAPDFHCDEVFTIVETQPYYPGGENALMDYLRSNIKYPQLARESNIQGTVFASFVVTASGFLNDIKILRGIGGGCDEETIRVIRNMPPWIPGKQKGIPVCVQYNLPIRFILNNEDKKKE